MNATKSSLPLITGLTALLFALPRPAAAQAQALPSSLSDCIALAIKQNPDVLTADHEITAATAQQKAARGNFGPKLHIDANLQRWDKPLAVAFGGGGAGSGLPPECQQGLQSPGCMTSRDGQILAGLLGGMSTPITVRAQTTWTTTLTLAQPLGALWTIEEAYALRKLGVDVARIGRRRAERDVAFQVTEAYFRLIQATQMEQIATKSVEQVDAQVQRAQSFFKNGMVGQNDLLRAQLGLAAAKQRLIQARGGVTLARGRLAMLMALPTDAAINPSDQVSAPPPMPAFTPADAEERALKDRIEFQEVAARIDQARHGVSLAKSRMLPQVNALGSFTHAVGSAFQPKDSWFIGGALSWDLWEWGATYYGIDEAKARVSQALAARSKAEDMIRLDVRNAYVTVTTSFEALEVARRAVEQAEENYRIEQKRYEAANNTSFDVLDAETQLTTARAQLQAALYDYVIAGSNLTRAIGRLPGEVTASR